MGELVAFPRIPLHQGNRCGGPDSFICRSPRRSAREPTAWTEGIREGCNAVQQEVLYRCWLLPVISGSWMDMGVDHRSAFVEPFADIFESDGRDIAFPQNAC